MIVSACPPVGRAILPGDFADLTPVEVLSIGWADDGSLAVEFAADLSPDVAQQVVDRVESKSSGEESLRQQARDFLTLAAADATQVAAQVAALTRLVLGAFD